MSGSGPTVHPGRVRVGEIDLVADHPDVRVWHLDLLTKRAWMSHPGDSSVVLHTADDSVGLDGAATEDTRVDFPPVPAGQRWLIFGEVSRYTGLVTQVRLRDAEELVPGSSRATAPELVACPGAGCRARAWAMPPDGQVWCEGLGGVVPPEQPVVPHVRPGPGPCPECREHCPDPGGGCPCVEPAEVCGCGLPPGSRGAALADSLAASYERHRQAGGVQ